MYNRAISFLAKRVVTRFAKNAFGYGLLQTFCLEVLVEPTPRATVGRLRRRRPRPRLPCRQEEDADPDGFPEPMERNRGSSRTDRRTANAEVGQIR